MVTVEEYLRKQAEFEARTDANCDGIPMLEADCSTCPCWDLCHWLCDNLPEELRVHGRA